jgi:hypothetical protein
MPRSTETPTPASRNIVQSLNALLKFARLYGLHHIRSDEQFEETWRELRASIEACGAAGFMIGTSGKDLVLNGTMPESSAAGQSLAHIFMNAGVASIVFTRELLEDSFLDFVKAFARGATKPSERLRFLRNSFEANPERGIRINEIRFVPAHPGNNAPSENWLRDPTQLATMIGTNGIEPSSRRFNSFEFGEELLGGANGEGFSRPVTEEEAEQVIELVAQIGAQPEEQPLEREEWKQRFDSLTENSKAVLQLALSELTAKRRLTRLDDVALVRLSNDIAIRCATERFESGIIGAEDVQPLLSQLCHSIARLRTALPSRKGRSEGTNISAPVQTDALEREFWASISEHDRQAVLVSSDSWCVPPRNIQQCVKELQRGGNRSIAESILQQYASCVSCAKPEARKRTAIGLNELADTYANFGGAPLSGAVRAIGEQLQRERDSEIQSLLSVAFVKLSRHAAERREFPAMQRMLVTLADLEKSRPSWTQSLRPRIGFDNRIPEFIEDGLSAAPLTSDFIEVMRGVPQAAAEHLANRLMRVARASEREKIVDLARAIGEPLHARLRQTLELAPAPKAVRVAGLLSRLEPAVVAQLLPRRIAAGRRETHDEALRQLSVAAAPERGRMLMSMIELLDSMILPMALDEIGMSGDVSVGPELLRLANGQRLSQSSDFVRVKAIEALGRLRVSAMEPHLLRFVEEKRAWRWAYPTEMRLAAAQALIKLDPERAPILLSNAGLDASLLNFAPLDARGDRDFVRYRRYQRIRMSHPVSAVVQSSRGKCQPEVQVLSLEGGLLSGDLRLSVGAPANLRISSGMRPIHLDVLVRFTKQNQAGIEMVSMDLEDRHRLRSLLVAMAPASAMRRGVPVPA